MELEFCTEFLNKYVFRKITSNFKNRSILVISV